MNLILSELPFDLVVGVYDIGGGKRMPRRSLYAHPEAVASLQHMLDFLVFSDIFRSPESSLNAVRRKRGAKRPGYSLHNVGLAIDIDVKATMRKLGLKTKRELDRWMAERGWYCHRIDHEMDAESWHYNFLGLFEDLDNKPLVISPKVRSTSGYGEALIQRLYGSQLKPLDIECQEMLKTLRMYGGKIDGVIGDQSKEAVRVFRRAWDLGDSPKIDDTFRRTLALVAATRTIV